MNIAIKTPNIAIVLSDTIGDVIYEYRAENVQGYFDIATLIKSAGELQQLVDTLMKSMQSTQPSNTL